jgi:hypothetical protein
MMSQGTHRAMAAEARASQHTKAPQVWRARRREGVGRGRRALVAHGPIGTAVGTVSREGADWPKQEGAGATRKEQVCGWVAVRASGGAPGCTPPTTRRRTSDGREVNWGRELVLGKAGSDAETVP